MNHHRMGLGQAAAEVIARRLEARRWTRADLARATGMSKATLNRKLSASVKFDLAAFDDIAHALGVDPGRLMREAVKLQSEVPDVSHEEQADRAIADMSPAEAAKVRRAAARIRPRKPQEPNSDVG